jgi:hypothetical protein
VLKKPNAVAKPARKEPNPHAHALLRAQLKEQITSILNAAGEAGASVKEIAAQVGKPIQHIYVWFSSTGKKLGHFEKTDAGKYRNKPAQQ